MSPVVQQGTKRKPNTVELPINVWGLSEVLGELICCRFLGFLQDFVCLVLPLLGFLLLWVFLVGVEAFCGLLFVHFILEGFVAFFRL